MNTKTDIDWQCWEVAEPTPEFVEQVMREIAGASAVGASHRRRSRRTLGWLAAAALTAGSVSVLAMVGRYGRARSDRSVPERRTAADGRAGAGVIETPGAGAPSDIAPVSALRAAHTVVDRELRDGVRARLASALEPESVERDPHTGLTIPKGTPGPSHNLSREYLQARIREDFLPLARVCYESALVRLPDLRGQIVVDFMIIGDAKLGGIVDQAEVNERTDIRDAEFTSCIRESMLSMVFAPPENDGWMTVTYPFRFAPEEEESTK